MRSTLQWQLIDVSLRYHISLISPKDNYTCGIVCSHTTQSGSYSKLVQKICVTVVSCHGYEWSTFVRHQWMSVAWYVESVSPPCERVTYYIAEAQRTIDIVDVDSFIVCLSALNVLLPKVSDVVLTQFYNLSLNATTAAAAVAAAASAFTTSDFVVCLA